MNIKEVIKASKDLGEWAHIATVSGSGTPYVTPVHPCWEGETLWIMVGVNSVKSKNIADSPSVSLHWQVSEETSFDSLILLNRKKTNRHPRDLVSYPNGMFHHFHIGNPLARLNLVRAAEPTTDCVRRKFLFRSEPYRWSFPSS